MARPTKYKKEYCDKVEEYLKECEEQSEETDDVCLPTLEGIALLLDVDRKTLYNWKEEYDEFFHTLEKAEYRQKKMLEENGLSGDYNSTIAKLMLSANHGMKERSDITTKDEKVSGDIELTEEDKELLNKAIDYGTGGNRENKKEGE